MVKSMKKIYASPGRSGMLRAIQHRFLVLFLLCFTTITVMAQDALSKKVTISLKEETLGNALEKIADAAGVKFT